MRTRGRVAPTILALAALAAALVAVRGSGGSPRHRAPRPVAQSSPAAPVVSLRRIPGLVSSRVGDRRLESGLDALLALPVLGSVGDQLCLVVHDGRPGTGGHPVYARGADLGLQPASNLKLATATAVLSRLGGDSRLRTEVRGPAPGPDGVVRGDLWLVGGGDPLLATAAFAAHASFDHGPRLATPLERLADGMVVAGVRRVEGRMIGDDSRYDRERYVSTWLARYLADHESGPLSALSVNDGFSRSNPPTPAPDPPAFAAETLVGLLAQRGITVQGGAGSGSAPSEPRALAAIDSPPLSAVVGEMLRESDNTTAELLTKELGLRLGRSGSTLAGTRAVKETLSVSGVAGLSSLAMADGSGLDRSDRASCTLLVDLLERGGGENGLLGRELAVSGRDGTLRKRFLGPSTLGRIRAKTGSLADVVSLSGWADGGYGHVLTFSLVMNGLSHETVGLGVEDRLTALLTSYPAAPAADALGPGASG